VQKADGGWGLPDYYTNPSKKRALPHLFSKILYPIFSQMIPHHFSTPCFFKISFSVTLSHLLLCLEDGLFLSYLGTTFLSSVTMSLLGLLQARPFFPLRATYSAYLIFPDFITIITFGEEYRLWTYVGCRKLIDWPQSDHGPLFDDLWPRR
jgi:hypothetical protein